MSSKTFKENLCDIGDLGVWQRGLRWGYCRTPDQTKNLERLYNCLVSCRCRHAQNSSDVTLAFEDAD